MTESRPGRLIPDGEVLGHTPARFECLEIGSSAGINLMMDRYAYDLGGVAVAPADPVMRFAPEWHGDPPPDRPVEIVSARGCDVSPVDLTDPVQALRLKAYIWPEHTVRFERMEAAVAAAMERAPDIADAIGDARIAAIRPTRLGATTSRLSCAEARTRTPGSPPGMTRVTGVPNRITQVSLPLG